MTDFLIDLLFYFNFSDEKEDANHSSLGGKGDNNVGQLATASITSTTPTLTNSSMGNSAPTATPEVDEDGYSIQPSKDSWDKEGSVPKSKLLL